jgi:hypothetical protein
MKPASIRRRVVFPHPEGPSKKNNSPDSIVKSMASTARVLSYLFVKPLRAITVIVQDNNRQLQNMGYIVHEFLV